MEYLDLAKTKYVLDNYGDGVYTLLSLSTVNFNGKTVVASNGTDSVSAVFTNNKAEMKIGWVGTYSLTVDGTEYGSVEVNQLGERLTATINRDMATINITTAETSLFGRTITVKKGATTVGTVAFNQSGSASFAVFETGTYTVSATDSTGETASASVEVTELVLSVYNVELSFVKLVSWATGTDAEISAMLDAYYAGSISIEQIKSVWAVGDSRMVSLSYMPPTGVNEYHLAQYVYFVIIGFEHDDLATPVGSRTKACVTIHMKDCLNEYGYMNDSYGSYTYAQYSTSKRRTWMNNVFEKSLPSYLQGLIKPVTKITQEPISNSESESGKSLVSSTERCFLLSNWEVFGTAYSSFATKQDGNQYEYYTTWINRFKKLNGNYYGWWTRTGFLSGAYAIFVYCSSGGAQDINYAHDIIGLAVGMAL